MTSINIVILGVLISIFYYELTDISPGGIVVPGLLVLYITQPFKLIYTIVIAFLSYLIAKLLSKKLLIFGKRRFVVLIIISLLLNLLFTGIFSLFSGITVSISLIGYTIAGLLANDFYKQGVKKTFPSLVIVVGILELIVLITSRFM